MYFDAGSFHTFCSHIYQGIFVFGPCPSRVTNQSLCCTIPALTEELKRKKISNYIPFNRFTPGKWFQKSLRYPTGSLPLDTVFSTGK